MNEAIRILLVEDHPGEARLIRERLEKAWGGPCSLETVTRAAEAVERLTAGGIDVVLLDLGLPDSTGPGTFAAVHAAARDIPVIVLTGMEDESLAVRMVREGAQDYLVKGQGEVEGAVLRRAIRYALERNRTDRALRKSEARFRCLFDSNTIGLIVTDTDGGIVEANDAFLEMVGRTRLELAAGEVPWDTMTPPEHAEQDREVVQDLAQHGTAGPFEKEYLHSNGGRVPVRMGMACLPDTPNECIGYVVDLSERNRAAESIQWLTKAVQQSPAGVLITDTNGRIEYVNQRFTEDTGYPAAEVIGRTPAVLQSGETPKEVFEGLWSTITGGGEWRGELLNRKNDGERFWSQSSISPLRDSKGTITHFLGVQQDITQRKHAESEILSLNESLERRVLERTNQLAGVNIELTRRERELQEYIDAMSTLNAKVAPDGTILLINRIAQQASGLPLESLINTSFLEGGWWTYDPQVVARVHDAFSQACSGKTVSYEERVLAFGKVMTINFSLVPIIGPDGQVAYVVAEGGDITRRVEAEEALKTANQELEAFTYSVSHDLRAPLRQVDGFCRILVEHAGPTVDDKSRHYLTRIQEGTQHMGRLVDDLLSLASVGRQDARIRSTPLGPVVDETVGDLRADLGDRKIQWSIGPLPTVACDPGLVKIVFTNLLSNAVKYTRPRPLAVIEVACTSQKGQMTFLVRDNGVGFKMKYADKLFGVFQRLHRTDQFEGTGVGLATVQRIIHKHGGRIWAEAEPDRGATFYFTLAPGTAHPVAQAQ
jgi:PAS domain S-box-containing protein